MTGPALWTSAETAVAAGGTAHGSWTASGVSIDSRTLAHGDLYIALHGERFDGHAFVDDAFARGAAAAMVHRAEALAHGTPGLVVADTQQALEALGRAGRARSAARRIAVTGSVGKTGTKEMLARAFGALGPTVASARSFNNHIGVPLTLASLPKDAAFAVSELGMNHKGEIAALTRQVRPEIAIVTTVEAVHLEFFGSVEAIADAKAEIFEGMDGGTAILNADNPHFDRLAAAARREGVGDIVAFGTGPKCAVRLIDCRSAAGGSEVTAAVHGREIRYRLGLEGRHWAMNSLAVLAAVGALDGDVEAAAQALAAITPPRGRGERHRLPWRDGTLEVVDDSYNASPASVRAALSVLGGTPAKGRRIAALGDMRELGPTAPALHAGLADDALRAGIDLVFTVGENMVNLRDALPAERRGAHAATADDLGTILKAALRPGDVVLVKGSLATGMGRVVEALLAEAAASPQGHAL